MHIDADIRHFCQKPPVSGDVSSRALPNILFTADFLDAAEHIFTNFSPLNFIFTRAIRHLLYGRR